MRQEKQKSVRCSGDLASMTLEALDHGIQSGLPGSQSDVMHEQSDDVRWQGQGNLGELIVHRRKHNSEHSGHGGRLPRVHVGIEMQGAVLASLGEQIDSGLAFWHREGRSIKRREPLGERLKFSGPGKERLHLVFAVEHPKLSEGSCKNRW